MAGRKTDSRAVTPRDTANRLFIQKLAALGVETRFEKDTVIIREGDPGDSLLVIRSGRVQIFSASRDGRQVLINEHAAGEYLGEMSLDGQCRSASARALEACVISVISREKALKFIASNAALSLDLIFELSRRARAATANFKDLALIDVYSRIVKLLESLAVESGAEMAISSLPTQSEIGQRVGASREMVGIILRDLAEGGYVSRVGRTLTIHRALPKRW